MNETTCLSILDTSVFDKKRVSSF